MEKRHEEVEKRVWKVEEEQRWLGWKLSLNIK